MVGRHLDQWRDKSILDLDAEKITNIEFKKKKGDFKLAKVDTMWKINSSLYTEEQDTKQDEVKAFIDRISNLRADDFAELPDLDGIDFKKPVLTLKLTLDDGSEEILSIVKKGEEDKMYVVTKEGEETFFILYQGSFDYLDRDLEDFKSET